MSEGIEVIGIYVRDQDEALAFYVDRLGFRVQADVRNGDYRWLTVQHPEQPVLQLGLCRPGPPVHDAATADALHGLVAKGVMPPLVLQVKEAEIRKFRSLSASMCLAQALVISYAFATTGDGKPVRDLKKAARK